MPLKVLFFTNVPAIRQHRLDLYCDAVSESFETEFWDLSPLYGRDEGNAGMEFPTVKVQSLGELEDRLKREQERWEPVIITNILLRRLNLIYSRVHRLGIPIVNITKETMYTWLFNTASVRKIGRLGTVSSLRVLFRLSPITRQLMYRKEYGGARYDYQLATYNFFPEESRHFVKIHNVKYDESLKARDQAPVVEGDYILFLDEALADHPMFRHGGVGIDRQKYLTSLNAYFALLEKETRMEVVISAHPKSQYAPEDFPGRKVIMYQTPVLIRYARSVVSHYCTSLLDVILQNKPFKALYSKELMDSPCERLILSGMQLARKVGVECVDLDNPVLHDFTVPARKYARFTRRYLVNPKKMDRSNGEIIVQFLKTLKPDRYDGPQA